MTESELIELAAQTMRGCPVVMPFDEMAREVFTAINLPQILEVVAALRVLIPTLDRAADRESGNCVHEGWGRETDRCSRCCARRVLKALASLDPS